MEYSSCLKGAILLGVQPLYLTILSILNILSNSCITDTCDNHDCAQTCSVTEGGVRECSCGDGYELGADNKSCDGKVL